MIRLIALTGKAHSGKSSLGLMLLQRLNWIPYAFANPVKKTVNELFVWDSRHSDGELKEVVDPRWGFSPRRAYQAFGTEFGRGLREDLWVHYANEVFTTVLNINSGLVITDMRFENEAKWVRDCGGLVVHVRRKGEYGIQTDHVSEKGIEFVPHKDYMTAECESLDQLLNEVHAINMIVKHDASV